MSNKQFDLTVLPLRQKTEKIRTKRPVDHRLFNVDNGVCVLILAPPRQGKSVTILNLLANSQFLKNYFTNVYLIGGTIKNDKSLEPLAKMYESTTYDYLDDKLIQQITDYQLQFDKEDRDNCCIVVDDAIALPKFQQRNSCITRLASNYRHILGSDDGGGMLLFSSQKMTSIPVTIRACANVILLGKTTNIGQRKAIIDEYADSFGGEEYFNKMMNITFKDKYSFLCLYVDGNKIHSTPCAYKNFTELLYPVPNMKEDANISLDEINKNNNCDEKINM